MSLCQTGHAEPEIEHQLGPVFGPWRSADANGNNDPARNSRGPAEVPQQPAEPLVTDHAGGWERQHVGLGLAGLGQRTVPQRLVRTLGVVVDHISLPTSALRQWSAIRGTRYLSRRSV